MESKILRLAAVTVTAAPLILASVKLGEATKKAFDDYANQTESKLDADAKSNRLKLMDRMSAERAKIFKGEIVAMPFAHRTTGSGASIKLHDGLINHWVGAMFIPGATVAQVRDVLQDYPVYSHIYAPDVTDSKLLKRNGDEFEVFLRLHRQVKVKIMLGYNFPVEFNANYRVKYAETGGVLQAKSVSTRIAQVKDPKKSHTEEEPIEDDSGYLWRLNSYWRVYQGVNPDGVFVECEAVSLSRSVPGFVEKMVTYFTTNFPEDSMRATLAATRKAVEERMKR